MELLIHFSSKALLVQIQSSFEHNFIHVVSPIRKNYFSCRLNIGFNHNLSSKFVIYDSQVFHVFEKLEFLKSADLVMNPTTSKLLKYFLNQSSKSQ